MRTGLIILAVFLVLFAIPVIINFSSTPEVVEEPAQTPTVTAPVIVPEETVAVQKPVEEVSDEGRFPGLLVTLPSLYGEVRIQDMDGIREISVNEGTMSGINLSNPTQQIYGWDYLECMEGPFSSGKLGSSASILNIGLGGGYLPTRFHEVYGATVESVEINPVVVEAAKEYFGHTLPVTVQDGRVFLQESSKTYDGIFIDAANYANYSYKVPRTLLSKEFYTLSKNKLSSQGFFVQHFVTAREFDPIFQDVLTTMRSVFSTVEYYNCRNGNVFIAHKNGFEFSNLDKYHREIEVDGQVLTDEFFPYN